MPRCHLSTVGPPSEVQGTGYRVQGTGYMLPCVHRRTSILRFELPLFYAGVDLLHAAYPRDTRSEINFLSAFATFGEHHVAYNTRSHVSDYDLDEMRPLGSARIDALRWRKDGFAYVGNARDDAPAELLTVLLDICGDELYVNLVVLAGGAFSVAVTNGTGSQLPLAGFSHADCTVLHGPLDSKSTKLHWARSWRELNGTRMALHFRLHRAQLYSFQSAWTSGVRQPKG